MDEIRRKRIERLGGEGSPRPNPISAPDKNPEPVVKKAPVPLAEIVPEPISRKSPPVTPKSTQVSIYYQSHIIFYLSRKLLLLPLYRVSKVSLLPCLLLYNLHL